MSRQAYSTYEIRIGAVQAVARGMPVGAAADKYGANRTTIFRWTRRYAENGADGLQRQPGSGRPRKLSELDRKRLWRIMLQPATKFGSKTDFWNISRIHGVVQDKLEVAISGDTVRRTLCEAGISYQMPGRDCDEAACEAQWRREASRIRRAVREYRAVFYRLDQMNVPLTAFSGKAG